MICKISCCILYTLRQLWFDNFNRAQKMMQSKSNSIVKCLIFCFYTCKEEKSTAAKIPQQINLNQCYDVCRRRRLEVHTHTYTRTKHQRHFCNYRFLSRFTLVEWVVISHVFYCNNLRSRQVFFAPSFMCIWTKIFAYLVAH